MVHKPSPPVPAQLGLRRQALLNKSKATYAPLLHVGEACALALVALAIPHRRVRGVGAAAISFVPSILQSR